MKQRSTAAILAFLLGGIGVHKFYLDNPQSGLIYILLCIVSCGTVSGVLALIDFVFYLTDTEEAFQRRVEEKKMFF